MQDSGPCCKVETGIKGINGQEIRKKEKQEGRDWGEGEGNQSALFFPPLPLHALPVYTVPFHMEKKLSLEEGSQPP